MATATAYCLNPRSAMHFGERGIGVESSALVCHADTLFSALCLALQDTDGVAQLRALLAEFGAEQRDPPDPPDPPFLLSSLFPHAGGVRFLPRPALPRHDQAPMPALAVAGDSGQTGSSQVADEHARKQLKKLRLVSWDLHARWTASAMDASPESGAAGERVQAAQDGAVWLTEAEWRVQRAARQRGGTWWKEEPVPRVTLDRITSASTIYHAGRVCFARGCGLYFLVWWRRSGWREAVERALHALGDAGIGGERSSGYGQFDVDGTEEVALPEAAGTNGFVTLSPYCPTARELAAGVLGTGAAWDLAPRGGWMGAPAVALRHSTVHMLVEGSALRFPDAAGGATGVYGQLVDVTPRPFTAHRVYRYGFAFPWPARLAPPGASAG